MEFKVELETKSAPKIKKAAQKISKSKIVEYEDLLLSALEFLVLKPKSWKAQSEVIRAIGITGSNKSLSYLKELVLRDFDATILYRDLGFSICMLEDIENKSFEYLESILETTNVSLLSGACSSILLSGILPSESTIKSILNSVVEHDKNEGQVITPRCYIAAACYSWPRELTEVFLQRCTKSSWSGLVEIANDSLASKKTKYILV
jgi:hypothetical protein